MLNIKKILLPVDIPIASLGVIHQAATLAHHFHSEIVMLHVVTPESDAVGVDNSSGSAGWDMLAEITGEAQKQQDQTLGPELEGLTIRRMVVKGDPARAIVHMAEEEDADLIMMPSYGATFNQFLLGSVTAKVLHGTECPVWTGAHVEESEHPSTAYNPLSLYDGVATRTAHPIQAIGHEVKQRQPVQEFAIRSVLCAVDLGPHSNEVVSWAAAMAAEFGARLTLAHITTSVELWGPGGRYVDQKWKEELVGDASQRIAKLQQDMGTKADVLIGSGDVPNVLSQAAKQKKADLLVTECYPYSGNLRIHGYAVICAVPIPVLSV
jgi:nucleotide-binding universal stress UspA family protein